MQDLNRLVNYYFSREGKKSVAYKPNSIKNTLIYAVHHLHTTQTTPTVYSILFYCISDYLSAINTTGTVGMTLEM